MDNLNGIHLIDCSEISEKSLAEIQNTAEFKTFTENVGNALKLNGIIYLINTGIREETILNLEKKLEEFYSLPFEAKKRYEKGAFINFDWWGWKGPTAKQIAYTRETFDFGSNPLFEDDSLYPKEVSGFKEAVLTFRKSTKDINAKLLQSLGDYFKLDDKDFFIRAHSALEENFAKSDFSVRGLYYPVQTEIPTNANEFRLIAHQDYGTLTYLYQNAGGGGLQAKLHTGKWVDVEYIPNSFVVNAGRCLEMWSGGNIPAAFHRVAWTERSKLESRISFGCFLSPNRDTCCLPVVEENPQWTASYAKMQPGELFGNYFKQQVMLLTTAAKNKPL